MPRRPLLPLPGTSVITGNFIGIAALPNTSHGLGVLYPKIKFAHHRAHRCQPESKYSPRPPTKHFLFSLLLLSSQWYIVALRCIWRALQEGLDVRPGVPSSQIINYISHGRKPLRSRYTFIVVCCVCEPLKAKTHQRNTVGGSWE